MAIERIKLNLIPTGRMPVCHASQYDKGRQIALDIYNGLHPYILSDEMLELDIRKSDGRIVTLDVPITARGNSVVFSTTEQMCAVAGANLCELKITKGADVIGSLNFYMEIERSPMENGLQSDSEINNLTTQIAGILDPMLDEKIPPVVEEILPQIIGDNYPTKAEVEDALANKANSSDVYTKNQVDTALSGKADTSTTYTKSEVNTALAEKADSDVVEAALATKASEAEVSDIRVGANGTTYPSAGDAVRGQFDELNEDFELVIDNLSEAYDFTQNEPIPYNLSPSTNKWTKSTTNYSTFYFAVPDYVKAIKIKANLLYNAAYAFLSSSNVVEHGATASYATGSTRTTLPTGEEAIIVVPDDCAYIWLAGTINGEDRNPSVFDYISGILQSAAYVSADGSDGNKGTLSSPFATVNMALQSGASRILINGGKYTQNIDLSLAKSKSLELINLTPTLKAVFYSPDCVITGSEELVAGYTNVYKATINKTFSTNNVWLFQDGVADNSTLISDTDRHPLQRGYQNRCFDTKIKKCSAAVLNDALTEIENSTDYCWFVDGTTLYFSRPQTVSSSNPICGSFGKTLFNNTQNGMTIKAVGIDCKYMGFNVNKTRNSKIADCSSLNVFGDGAFTFAQACEVEFLRCEAARAFEGTNGDGFNAHSLKTGDAFAHQTTATLIDCWAHDNRDDGVSSHERSEATIIGGLYEQNYYGGGVTPASGAHFTCLGVVARHNGEGGFLYMNSTAPDEGGVGGQIQCVDCISKANNIWSSATSAGYKVTASGNKATLINCKAIDEDNGYYLSNIDSLIELIDCGALNCTNNKGGQTTQIKVLNTAIVN